MAKGDMFLKIDGPSGPVKGESEAPGHMEEIEISDWSWGMQKPHALGDLKTQGKAALSEIRFSKSVDRATTALMAMLYRGNDILKGVLTVRKAGSNPPVDYLVITFERGRFTSHNIGVVSTDNPIPIESFTVAFEKITVAYAPQLKSGGKGASSDFNADVNSR